MKGQKMFNQNLQKLRAEKNISQEQLADKIGVSRQSVSAWESGKSSPELDKLITLSELFEISLDELTSEISTKKANFNKKEYEKSYQKIALIRALGMFILFAGLAVAAYFSGSTASFNVLAGVGLMLSLAISVPLLILAKNFDNSETENLLDYNIEIDKFFSKNEIRQVKNIKNSSTMALVSTLFTAIAAHQIIYHFSNLGINLANTIFMALLGIGISASTYGNSIFSKINNFYEIENKDEEKDSKIGFFAAIIMLSITAIYLTYSFITNDWASARILYTIGGIAIAIFTIFIKRKN